MAEMAEKNWVFVLNARETNEKSRKIGLTPVKK